MELWLARKGCREENDIYRLEELAGPLTRGLLVVLHAPATLALETPKNKSLRPPNETPRSLYLPAI